MPDLSSYRRAPSVSPASAPSSASPSRSPAITASPWTLGVRGLAAGVALTLAMASPVAHAGTITRVQVSAVEGPAAPEDVGSDASPSDGAGEDAAAEGAIPPPADETFIEDPILLDSQARAAFDAQDYLSAAIRWEQAAEITEENDDNHLMRVVMVLNAVTAYEQVFAETGDLGNLDRARDLMRAYLKSCKEAYTPTGCNGFSETNEVRARLQSVNEEILAYTPPKVVRVPPEGDVAVGGRPFDRTYEPYPLPPWSVLSVFIGAASIAGGTAMIIHGTNPKFAVADDGTAGELSARDGGTGTGTTGTGTGTGTGTTGGGTTGGTTGGTGTGTGSTGTSTLGEFELPPETKGRLLIGFGSLIAALGVGMIVYGGISLAKYRRINRRERVAFTPSLGRTGAGFSISGRF